MKKKITVRDYSMGLALLLIWMFFALASENFLSPRNLSMLSIELAITASLALGMFLVLLPGHIDLSAGSGVGLIGGIGSVLVFHHHWPAPVAMGMGLLVAVVLWGGMGFLIIGQRVPAFIITLGGLLIFKGVFWRVIGNATVPVSEGSSENLYSLLTTYYLPENVGYVLGGLVVLGLLIANLRTRGQRKRYGFAVDDGELCFLKLFITFQVVVLLVVVMGLFRGIPLAVVILGVLVLLVYVVTQHTPFGRYLYAIGGNEEAAALSGIPIKKVVVGAYMMMGVIVALTGFMQTAYTGASTTTVGDLMELDAIAACVIGGTSLRGGRGSVLGVLFGALIMASLLNGMTLLAVTPEMKFIARGVVLVLAVWVDVALRARSN